MDFKKLYFAVGLMACTFSVNAAVVSGNGLETLLDDLTVASTANPTGESSIDVLTDQLSPSAYWRNTDSGISPTRLVTGLSGTPGLSAFGIYDFHDEDSTVSLFSAGSSEGSMTAFGIALDGSVYAGLFGGFFDTGVDFLGQSFGFYLELDNGDTLYSDASLNNDEDRMIAFQGGHGDYISLPSMFGGFGSAAQMWTEGGYLLAFDIDGDNSFDDFSIFVESARPVSAPGSFALMGIGLLSLYSVRRRLKANA